MKINSNNSGISLFGRYLLIAVLAGGAVFGLSACEKKGPMEEAGESIDQGMEDMGDSMNEGAEEVQDEVDDHTTN